VVAELTKKIKEEIVYTTLSYKDIFLAHGIILEEFDFEIEEKYEKILKEKFLAPETPSCYLRIPLNGSKNIFEFAVFLNKFSEPNVSYHLYKTFAFPISKPEVSLEIPFAHWFIEEHFRSYSAFKNFAFPILKEYFSEREVETILDLVGGVAIEIEPYIKYTEIII
jgi:hypothetical protein